MTRSNLLNATIHSAPGHVILRARASSHRQSCAGATLLATLGLVVVLTMLIGAIYTHTGQVARVSQRSRALQDATTAGIGALDVAFSGWRAVSRANGTFAQGLPTSSFADIPVPTASQFSGIPGLTFGNYKVQAVDPQISVNSSGNSTLASNTIPPAATGMNTSETSYYYLASVDVKIPITSGAVTTKVRRILQKQNVSPWSYALFFNDDLEIHPGPSFAVTGMVHTNGSLYTGHSSLTFASKVSFSDQWMIGFKPGDGEHQETPTSPNWPSDLPPAAESTHQPLGLDTAYSFSTTDVNPNNDNWRELIQQPVAGYSDPVASQRYYNQAGIKVAIDNANVVTIRNAAGAIITSGSPGNDRKTYTTVSAALQTNKSLQDNREGATMRVVNLDIGIITAAVKNASGSGNSLPGFNGIIYISDTSGQTAGNHRGIKLINGASLPPGGLTVASDNPVYIQGDYNTGRTSLADPHSNSGDPTAPTVTGYTRQPASVLADAVTILSNNWSDANAAASLSSRSATSTTVNTAILAGTVPSGTVGNNYSGGAENFPRFLEDWSSSTLTYYGSMVELFSSAQAKGVWGSGNVYSPPTRMWYFDNNFLTNPPPGNLTTTNYNKQRWYLQ